MTIETLDTITARIAAKLDRHRGRTLTDEEFRSQMESFIVGNAFDALQDAHTITSKTVTHSFENRRHINKVIAHNGGD